MPSTELGYTLLVLRNTDFEAYTTRRVSIVGVRIAQCVWKSLHTNRPDFPIWRPYRSILEYYCRFLAVIQLVGFASHLQVVV